MGGSTVKPLVIDVCVVIVFIVSHICIIIAKHEVCTCGPVINIILIICVCFRVKLTVNLPKLEPFTCDHHLYHTS